MENLEVALYLASLGWHVFPCVGAGKPENLKKPWPGLGWRHVSTTDERAIRALWNGRPTAVPGVDCDKSGLITVDCDCKHGVDGKAWVASLGVDVEDTPGSVTPSGGRHLIYRNPLGLTNGRGNLPGKDVADIDIRAKGGFIIGPGAHFADGRGYETIGDLSALEDLPDVIADYLTAKKAPSGNGREMPGNSYGQNPPKLSEGFVHTTDITDYRLRAFGQAGIQALEAELAASPEGSRNNDANLIGFRAGQLVGGGCLDLGEAIQRLEAAALGWGVSYKDKALGPRGTIQRAIQAGEAHPRGPAERERPAVVINLKGVVNSFDHTQEDPFATPYEWTDPQSIPKRDWLYGQLLCRKFTTITIAPGGVGKSSLVTVEALAQVSGHKLLDHMPPKRLKVWLWNLEDPLEELRRKIQATCLHYGLKREDLEGHLFVNSGRGQSEDRKLVLAKQTGKLITMTPIADMLIAEIRRLEIDILVVDPYVSCNEVDENDNTAQDKVVKAWARVADEGACAVHLVDHANKMAKKEGTTSASTRGASAKVDGARVVRVINPMSLEQGVELGIEDHRRYFSTMNDKANLSLPPAKLDWYRLESVCLGNGTPGATVFGQEIPADGDSVGVVTCWSYPSLAAADEGVDFPLVEAALQGGEWRTSSKSKNGSWIGEPIARALNLDLKKAPDLATVKRLIKLWESNGKLEAYSVIDKKGNSRPCLRVPE